MHSPVCQAGVQNQPDACGRQKRVFDPLVQEDAGRTPCGHLFVNGRHFGHPLMLFPKGKAKETPKLAFLVTAKSVPWGPKLLQELLNTSCRCTHLGKLVVVIIAYTAELHVGWVIHSDPSTCEAQVGESMDVQSQPNIRSTFQVSQDCLGTMSQKKGEGRERLQQLRGLASLTEDRAWF